MTLTDEEIRIKVAEALGWKNTPFGEPREWHQKTWRTLNECPNYPESLNACAEFEATLTLQEVSDYGKHLERIVTPFQASARVTGQIWHATARQRCLAYLKTKGILP